ncbi:MULTISPECIES: endonuclease MutS2 [unclassified Bacillus (in: firmicutes)]|uniref:endonuclease MutS2 n=1 Tax=unclassified Bacillus (in: firmicutes) TaxID=185979 RepID=UPI000BF19B14|nr:MULTISPECIES: endonuclease MutS2 [unclassified Bacillus (in: firmicutes)]PEJ56666.1 endonuclease MutS2 [Bacillus sp. AFS002410]PEL06514.1 endonuclease MutS2 [Bacillus sp. AFS017336]
MNRTLRVLEYEKIKEQLLKHASSSLGKERIKNLLPSTDYDEVVELHESTDEAVKVIRLRGNVPLGGLTDIRMQVKRADIGGMLSPSELIAISGVTYAGRQMIRFIEGLIESEVEIPYLESLSEQIIPLLELDKNIKTAIGDNGEVLDDASVALRMIRGQVRTAEARIREKLESLTRGSNAQKMLSDSIVTIRNDRFVIPVKQEYRHVYGGIVHDQSSSGQTLFIEPQAIVTLNNSLQEAKVKEEQEIEKILMALTGQVAEASEDLLQNVKILAEMDFLFAKANYSHAIKASKPILNNERYFKLKKARHPLIPRDVVVANDIELGKEYTTIVITGPNTGGKTVTLKTIGICVLMAQSGLQIPALDGSEICVFEQVFADIGDEQSIEQSLSTFSSHMVNIVDILKHVNHNSLVLFDELGAGTDPGEGAALAISILDEVSDYGARVVATTHYPELKAYSYNREQVMNASVEFDVETLSPTYRLLIGVPGRSNAFEISRRLGLSNRVIEKARNHVSEESNEVENMIASLETSRKGAETEWKEAEDFRKESERIFKDLQKQMMEFYDHRDELYRGAQEEAKKRVKVAQQEAEDIIKELRQLKNSQLSSIKDHELIEARTRLEGAIPYAPKKTIPQAAPKKQKKLREGDEVKVISFNQKGTLLDKIGESEWQVQLGIIKMKVKESDIEYISSPKEVKERTVTSVKGKDFHVNLELDLRGERYEDALIRVEKYIDDALLAGYPRINIIHGKGTGALRQGVQEYLKKHRAVKSYRYGAASEGGIGVTVVDLK